MRIALVTDCYLPRLGGIEVQVHELGRHLLAAGHEVEVITPSPGPAEVEGIPVQRLDVPLLPFDIPFSRATFRELERRLVAGRYDVVHCHGGVVSPFAFGGTYLAQRNGFPTVATSHCVWSHTDTVFAGFDRALHWSDWRVVFSGVSDLAASEIRQIVGPDRPVLVLPNGIESAQWRVERQPTADDTVTIVSVMRLARRKRPGPLLHMLAQLRRRIPPSIRLRAVVVGEGRQRPVLEHTIDRLGLHDVVELAGARGHDHIKDVYATADVYVAPANLESFGLAALEARCAGLPVVAKAQTGIREFIEHGVEGLLAASDHQMVAHLTRLVREPELRRKIAEHNATTPPRVEWREVVVANLDAYRLAAELAGGGSPASR